MAKFRRFVLDRDRDVSGVSGEGVVAEGVQFGDPICLTWPDSGRTDLPAGWCLVRWRGRYRSTVLWPSLEALIAVNGHDGATRVVWLDEPLAEFIPSGPS